MNWPSVAIGAGFMLVLVVLLVGWLLPKPENVRNTGVHRLATIERMESSGESSVKVSISWTEPEVKRRKEFLSNCDMADLPRVGDHVEIICPRDQTGGVVLWNGKTLRRDTLVSPGMGDVA